MLLDDFCQLPNIGFRTLFGNLHQVLNVQHNALNMLVLLASALGGLMEKPYKDIELTEKSELAEA